MYLHLCTTCFLQYQLLFNDFGFLSNHLACIISLVSQMLRLIYRHLLIYNYTSSFKKEECSWLKLFQKFVFRVFVAIVESNECSLNNRPIATVLVLTLFIAFADLPLATPTENKKGCISSFARNVINARPAQRPTRPFPRQYGFRHRHVEGFRWLSCYFNLIGFVLCVDSITSSRPNRSFCL